MGQKEHFWPKTTKLWPKNRKQEFYRGIFFRHFLKDQKIGSYGKNQENLWYTLGEMSQKEQFWTKKGQTAPGGE